MSTKANYKVIKHAQGIVLGTGVPLEAKTINRNDLCKCGSGKKAKKCCGCKTVYYA